MHARLLAIGLGLSLALTVRASDDSVTAFSTAFAKVQTSHRFLADAWYAQLTHTSPAPAIVRLALAGFTGPANLRVEFPLADGWSRRATAWVFDKRHYACPCDGSSLAFDPAAGTLKGTFTILLPPGFESAPGYRRAESELLETAPDKAEDLTIALDGTVAAGRCGGTFACAAAGTRGEVAGDVVPLAAAGNRPRGLPEFDPQRLALAEQYSLAAGLENDAVRLYAWLRAAGDDLPVPARPPFLDAKREAPKPVAPQRGKPNSAGRGKAAAPARTPSLDDAADLLEAKPAAKSPIAAPTVEDSARARLPQMKAMAAQTEWLAEIVARSQRPRAPVVVERGRTFDDPLFGPWYGTGSLATGAVNRLPPEAGAPGVQDWPFVQAWQFLGPFDFPPAQSDPVWFPDCAPPADTEYVGRTGPIRWRAAQILPSGCAMLTDVEPDEVASETDVEQNPDTPARAHKWARPVYYAVTTLESGRDVELPLAAGCTGRMSVWLDDVLVARGPATDNPGDITQEALVFTARLHRGVNRLLVRCEADAYGLFTHRRPGTGSYFWMRACVRGAPGDAAKSRAWLAEVERKKASLPNLPANVRGFRGDQTGFFPEADSVTAWDIERGVNVRWIAPLERWSKASPLVVGDRVFICAEPHVLLCLDALTGKVLWRRSANVLDLVDPALGAASEKLHQEFLGAKAAVAPKLAELGPDYAARLRTLAAQGRPLPQAVVDLRALERDAERKYGAFFDHLRQHGKLVSPAWDGHYSGPWLGYTFATPVTDGRQVYVQFRTGVAAAYDLDGNRRWMVRTPYEVGGVSVCSSPVLADDKLVICQPSAAGREGAAVTLTALDAATGRTVWSARADSRSQISSPVVMRLTDGAQAMTVVATDGGTVVRADDGKVLVIGLRGGSGTGSPTPVGDLLCRIELAQGGAVRLIMLDRDTVGARWQWSCGGLYNSIYAGVGQANGLLFGTTHGGSQCINHTGLDLISMATGQRVERPFNLDAAKQKQGIFAYPRGGFVPPVASPRAVYIATRGQGHASSLAEELPNRWSPYACVSVAAPGVLGRFIAHNKVVAPLTPHLALAGDRVYLRNDQELTCFGYTGDEGRAYEAEVNATTVLADISDEPGGDAKLWRDGLACAKPILERVIALKPGCAAAQRAKVLLGRL